MTESQEVSFLSSLKALIPFTNAYKQTNDLVNELQDKSLIEGEIERVTYIQSLIRQGLHEEAFTELKLDAASLDLHYFNRVKQKYGKLDHTEPSLDVSDGSEAMGGEISICTWTGKSTKGINYYCSNECIGDLRTCSFHAKYCINPYKSHDGAVGVVRIRVANEYALCTECYVAKTSQLPLPIRINRIPGVHRVMDDNKNENTSSKATEDSVDGEDANAYPRCCDTVGQGLPINLVNRRDEEGDSLENSKSSVDPKQIKRFNAYRIFSVTAARLIGKRKHRDKDNNAVIIIQKLWKQPKASLILESERIYNVQHKGARYIQRAYRYHVARKTWLRHIFACKKIQCVFRGYMGRRCTANFSLAALAIQRRWKLYLVLIKLAADARREQKFLWEKMHQASTKIQTNVRVHFAMLATSRLREVKFLNLCACVVLQSRFRGARARKSYTNIIDAILVLQRSWKVVQENRRMNQIIDESAHAVKLQKMERGSFERQMSCCTHSSFSPCNTSTDRSLGTAVYQGDIRHKKSYDGNEKMDSEHVARHPMETENLESANICCESGIVSMDKLIHILAKKENCHGLGFRADGVTIDKALMLPKSEISVTREAPLVRRKRKTPPQGSGGRKVESYLSKSNHCFLQRSSSRTPTSSEVNNGLCMIRPKIEKTRTDALLEPVLPTGYISRNSSICAGSVTKPQKNCVFPYCNAKSPDIEMLLKHIKADHSDDEMRNLLESLNNTHHTSITWIGKYMCAPPFNPLVALRLCGKHFAPNIKCTTCSEIVKSRGPQQPVRIYSCVKVKRNMTLHERPMEVMFSAANKERAILIEGENKETRWYEVQSMCEDALGNSYIAVRKYLSKLDIAKMYRSNLNDKADTNELFIDDKISWLRLGNNVKGHGYVLKCSGREYWTRLKRGELYNYTRGGMEVKFCQFIKRTNINGKLF